MTFTAPLISADELRNRMETSEAVAIFDCSFDLADAAAGARAHETSRLPGARYLHLEQDLSGPKSPAGPIEGGRHPLPTRALLAERVGHWGIGPDTPVVVYDNQGSPYAARAWWLLRWLGHTPVAVLDGGLAAWVAAGGPVEQGPVSATDVHGALPPYPKSPTSPAGMGTVSAEDLLAKPGQHAVIDARAPERFRGDVEPLDRVAGHIPGARNRFFKDNLDAATGRFKPAAELKAAFEAYGLAPAQIVHQCGSGVTACHNLLAMAQAGLEGSRLYPGSWSEWSADPARPVARS
jgi:thiosulfate/3-mercaptopyruvate sulfurtransferase